MNAIFDGFAKGFGAALNHTTLTPNQAIKAAAVLSALQGLVLANYLFQISKVGDATDKQFLFLVDIVNRNVEHLEEFDLIALRELGVLKESAK